MSRRLALIEAQRYAWAAEQSRDAPLLRRIRQLEVQLAAAQTPAPGVPDKLSELNASRQAQCNALKAAIAEALDASPHHEAMTAKHVLQALVRCGFEPLPSNRTVRLRLAEVRAEMTARGNTCVTTGTVET